MTTLARPLPAANARALLARLGAKNGALALLTLAMAVVALFGLAGVALDPRVVVGAPVWAKTTKFAISIGLYGATMLWMLSFVKGRPRLVRFVAGSVSALLALEMVLIVTQAVRGRAMHFNYATPLDATLFAIMGASIGVFWIINLVAVGLLLLQRLPSPTLAWGLRLGLIVASIGFAQGALMTGPTAAQEVAMSAGLGASIIGAHTVGAPDGGPGIPFLGWSTTHGDLRVGHFVGIHAMQLVPLLAVFLARRREPWLREGHRVALVWLGGLGYLGLVALVTWQALRGQPLTAPDGLTLTALAGLVAVVAALASTVVAHALAGRRAFGGAA